MLRVLLTLILNLTILTLSVGQITTTKVASRYDESKVSKYDSLSNFLGKEVYKYLGQDLYLKGKSESLRKYGYKGFYTDYNRAQFDGSVYKCCDSYNSKYSELVGRYFKVLDIIKHPKATENEYLYGNKYYLKLQEKSSGDIVYYEYDTEYERSFSFIVVGFFEKLKKHTKGQKYIFGNTKLRFGEDELDVKTGKKIVFELGEKWECIDVTIEEQYYNLSLLLKDDDGQIMAIGYEMVIGANKFHDVFTENEAEKYKTSFGVENWNSILQGKVRIGMTKEMCKLSWGDPERINETITAGKISEQWVYTDNYIYFENGKLTVIQ
jgi:hypothetical protein